MGQQSPNIYMTSTLSSLPTEIQNAADYLALGGQPEDLPALARSGIFLEHLDPDAITRAIDYMESAGEASGAYQAAKVETQDKTWDSGQKFQQTMGEVTWVTGMPRLGNHENQIA